MCWRNHEENHKILYESVDESDSEEIIENEDNSENDVEDNNEKTRIWFWCWFWWCWSEKRDFVLRIVLKIVLRREKFFSFYTTEWKMSLERKRTKHDNEFDRRLLDKKEWDFVDFRRFRHLHFLLTNTTVLVSSIMKLFTYCAFCFDDEHLTNIFLMIWFFVSIACWNRKTLIFDVIISSAIVTLLNFAVTKKSLARVNFVVSDEMSLNDCVDRFDENEFQHDVDLFIFVENDFLQSSHVNNFFRSQFWYSRRICINQRLDDDRYAAIVMKSENADFDRVHQNLEDFQLHSDLDIIQSDSLKMLIKKHHVLLLANEQLDVLTAKMLKNQNSIFRITWNIFDFSKLVFHAIDDNVHFRDDLNDCSVLQTLYDVLVAVLDHHAQILLENSHHCQFFFLTRRIRLENRQRRDDFCQISMHVIDFFQHALQIEDFWLNMNFDDQALQTIKDLQNACFEHNLLTSL